MLAWFCFAGIYGVPTQYRSYSDEDISEGAKWMDEWNSRGLESERVVQMVSYLHVIKKEKKPILRERHAELSVWPIGYTLISHQGRQVSIPRL